MCPNTFILAHSSFPVHTRSPTHEILSPPLTDASPQAAAPSLVPALPNTPPDTCSSHCFPPPMCCSEAFGHATLFQPTPSLGPATCLSCCLLEKPMTGSSNIPALFHGVTWISGDGQGWTKLYVTPTRASKSYHCCDAVTHPHPHVLLAARECYWEATKGEKNHL